MQNNFCIICGKSNVKVVGKKGILHKLGEPMNITNVICLNCGLVFLNPRPSPSEYDNLYKKYGEIRHSLKDKEAIISFIKFAEKKKKGSDVLEFIKKICHPGSHILDIGCGLGTIIHLLKENLGYTVFGIEPDRFLAQIVSAHYGFPVFGGTLEEFLEQPINKKFDFIILHHVFEHFVDPLNKLKELESLLSSRGVIYIEVPNIVDFKKPADRFFDILHPYSYSPATLNKVLNLGGFKIIAWNEAKKKRIQILAARTESTVIALQNKEFNYQKIVSKTLNYLRKRRFIDLIKRTWPH